jgi:hypothetical protein
LSALLTMLATPRRTGELPFHVESYGRGRVCGGDSAKGDLALLGAEGEPVLTVAAAGPAWPGWRLKFLAQINIDTTLLQRIFSCHSAMHSNGLKSEHQRFEQ